MLCGKKNRPRETHDTEEPIDFAWVFYIGMNKLGFSYKQIQHITLGLWVDLFEVYKSQYNFETRRMLYKTEEPDGSLVDL